MQDYIKHLTNCCLYTPQVFFIHLTFKCFFFFLTETRAICLQLFFQDLKETTHLCCVSPGSSAVSFIIYLFEGNMPFLLWQHFLLVFNFQEFMLCLVVIFFCHLSSSVFLFFKYVSLFVSSGLLLFIISSNLLQPLILSSHILCF